MNKRSFPQRLRAGEPLYGTLIVAPSPRWPEQVVKLGLDFVFIDTEHIALEREKLSWMCQTYRALGLYPIVRIYRPDPYLACIALDGGACGIVAPYIESPGQVRELVGAVKNRPVKGQKLEGMLNGDAPEPKLARYLNEANGDSVLIANIESVASIEELDEILSVEGLDGALIGPHDLSCSLGIPEEWDNPIFDEAVRKIIASARSKGLGAGIHCVMGTDYLDVEKSWIEAGSNMVLHSADIIAAMHSLKREFDYLKKGSGRFVSPVESDKINI